jgi:hypothetical protein
MAKLPDTLNNMNTERLAAKVRAVNAANKIANELYLLLKTNFEPLLGKPILKQDGSLLAKYDHLKPAHDFMRGENAGQVIYRLSSKYSLAWCVKTCEQIEGTCTCLYHEVVVYVGDLTGTVLAKMSNPQHDHKRRTDYTAEEIIGLREKYEAAKKVADDAQSALYPFGEHDR